MVLVRKNRHAKLEEHRTRSVFPMRHIVGSEREAPGEFENLLYEEFDTNKHEILAVCLENEDRAAAICLFLNDKEIEFYSEQFPPCCRSHDDGSDRVFRSVMTAVSHWAPKWTYAEAVNLLCQSRDFVRKVSKGTTAEWRAINKFEDKNDFTMFLQWSDNFVCGEVTNEDLWSELIALCRTLLNGGDTEDLSEAWDDFPVGHWRHRRVGVSRDCFHHVPHPGEVRK